MESPFSDAQLGGQMQKASRMRLRPKSIKNAITLGATAGLIMLLGLAATSLISLFRYNHAISDLDYAVNKMPRKSELAYDFSRLFAPLQDQSLNQKAQTAQRLKFLEIAGEVEKSLSNFRRLSEDLPGARQTLSGHTNSQLLGRLERGIRLLKADAAAQGTGLVGVNHDETRRDLLGRVQGMFAQIEHLPQLSDTVKVPLQRSRLRYHRLVIIVGCITGLAVGLYLLLVYFGYRGISNPIQEVVRGARRVAQREFTYRINVHWPEEMAELAGAFNMMTGRFQEAEVELEKQVEERSRQLVRSERLADVGFIAAGVSHEINNPLHAIMGAAESLQERLPGMTEGAPESEVSAVREYLKMIQRQSDRCSRITSMLKDFARKGDDTRSATNLVRIVDEVLELVGHLSKYRDREIVFARNTAAVVEINPSQMQQVVLNLVANALESMEAGGRLEIRITDQIDFVVMEFEDNGCGMTQEVQDNLFEPFFTQRRDGGGTGLGLSITDRIVKDHEGTIEVTSEGIGHGSLFRVRLPRRAVQSDAA